MFLILTLCKHDHLRGEMWYQNIHSVFCITSSLPNVVLCEVTCVNNQIFHMHNNRWPRKLFLAESDSIHCRWVLNTNSTFVLSVCGGRNPHSKCSKLTHYWTQWMYPINLADPERRKSKERNLLFPYVSVLTQESNS